MIQVDFDKTFEGWRKEARHLILQKVEPSRLDWQVQTPSLFREEIPTFENRKKIFSEFKVSKEFMDLAQTVSCARDDDKWDLLYRILFRLQFENKDLLQINVDSDVHRAYQLEKSIKRDIHKMHAFVRFKKIEQDGSEIYVAWHKPEHIIYRSGTPFFARRFGDKKWSIFTPDGSAHWNLEKLIFGPGKESHDFQNQDQWDEVWKTYYKSIFNPARIKIKAMTTEMSRKYWSSLPEASVIDELVRSAPKRLQDMQANQNLMATVDESLPLSELRTAASSCQACPLFGKATQTVFGEGPLDAKLMIVGEQPGDVEDQLGRPFMGPAGEILNENLKSLSVDRNQFYLTNAVKHFKWEPQGQTRLHKKASGREIHACKPWLEAEIKKIKPKVIVLLGATAAQAVLGKLVKISETRGKVINNCGWAEKVIVSWHPAAILRAFDENEKNKRMHELQSDLRLALESVDGNFI